MGLGVGGVYRGYTGRMENNMQPTIKGLGFRAWGFGFRAWDVGFYSSAPAAFAACGCLPKNLQR